MKNCSQFSVSLNRCLSQRFKYKYNSLKQAPCAFIRCKRTHKAAPILDAYFFRCDTIE